MSKENIINIVFVIILTSCIMTLAETNYLYGILSIIIVTMPIAVTYFLKVRKYPSDTKIINQELNRIIKNCLRMLGIIVLIVIFTQAFVYKDAETVKNNYYIMHNTIYFEILISELLIVNYLATPSSEIGKSIMSFNNSLVDYFDKNFLISILILLVCIFLEQMSKDLFLATIGAYLFHFLTKVNEKYQSNKGDSSKYNKADFWLQLIINIILIYIFVDFEKLFYCYTQGHILDAGYWLNAFFKQILFIVVIIINYFSNYIYILKSKIMAKIQKTDRK